MPTASDPKTRGSLHPAAGASMIPKTSAASPIVASSAPARSSRPADGLRVSGTSASGRSRSTTAAIGRFTRNTARQDAAWTSHPPATGPSAPATDVSDDHVPTARPRSFGEKAAPRMARLEGITSARAHALNRAGRDEEPDAGRERAGGRGGGEERDADRENAPPPEPIGEGSPDENESGEGQRVGFHDPLDVGDRRLQALLEDGQRDVDDRPVDERQARAEDRRGEDPARGGSGAGCGLGRARRIASSQGPLAATLTRNALRLRRGEVRRGNRIRRTFRVPDHGRDPPSLAVVDELDRVDPALERLRVGR